MRGNNDQNNNKLAKIRQIKQQPIDKEKKLDAYINLLQMLQQRNIKKNLSTIKEVPEEYQQSAYLNKSKIYDMNINHSKENIDEYKPVKNHYKIEAKPKIYTTSDIEGRVDLLILFLIDCKYIPESKFGRSELKLLRNKLPKDYTERDFQYLEGIIRKTTEYLTKRNIYNVKVRKPLKNPTKIVLVGDLFGNRPLCYKVNKNGKTIVNLKENDRGGITLSGAKEENDFNYQKIISMNQAISDICTLLAYDKNVYLIGGNHEVYGSYSKCHSYRIDSFYRNDTGLENDEKEIKHLNKDGNELDDIKKHFIERLNFIEKPLLQYKSFDIGKKKFLFKHTPFLESQEDLNYMCNEKPQQLFYDQFFADKTELMDFEEDFIMEKHTSDFITNGELKNNNVVLVYGHTSSASKNQQTFNQNNALCVDCNIFEQKEQEKCRKNVNFFEILDNGKIKERNFYTKEIINEFKPSKKEKHKEHNKEIKNNKKEHKKKYFIPTCAPTCALTGDAYKQAIAKKINAEYAKNNTTTTNLPIIKM